MKKHRYFREGLFKKARNRTFKYAKKLRKKPTRAEELLWQRLKGKKTGGKFRRQHPLGVYIVDFYCHEKKLVIEVDGSVHDSKEQKENDENRAAELERMGLKIIRIRNEEIEKDMKAVLEKIDSAISAK